MQKIYKILKTINEFKEIVFSICIVFYGALSLFNYLKSTPLREDIHANTQALEVLESQSKDHVSYQEFVEVKTDVRETRKDVGDILKILVK